MTEVDHDLPAYRLLPLNALLTVEQIHGARRSMSEVWAGLAAKDPEMVDTSASAQPAGTPAYATRTTRPAPSGGVSISAMLTDLADSLAGETVFDRMWLPSVTDGEILRVSDGVPDPRRLRSHWRGRRLESERPETVTSV